MVAWRVGDGRGDDGQLCRADGDDGLDVESKNRWIGFAAERGAGVEDAYCDRRDGIGVFWYSTCAVFPAFAGTDFVGGAIGAGDGRGRRGLPGSLFDARPG